MADPAYRTILLKLSGAFLAGDASRGIDFDKAGRLCDELAEAHGLAARIGIVIGGGNILRGLDTEDTELDRPTRDYMGMLGTAINALALAGLLECRGVPARVMTAIPMGPVAEPYSRPAALRHLDEGRVVLFAAGTGQPFFTTDTAAALRASEIGAEILMKATHVDGVFDADPHVVADAKRYESLDYTTVLAKHLRVMDATAISLCRENKLPVLVFNLTRPGSIMRAIQGEPIGTIVK
ncbi:MAG TPA: UMP kinase [Candidatus Hydrogenedentes bacterium]|nr:UMP kinase [Candidatus Hydrogenedentota bacterium]HPG68674.1 UMP kinase [Candidatus Hydrogenedentota bacterium]